MPVDSFKRLHLGCGRVHIPGMYHIDIQGAPHVDRVASIENLYFIPDNNAELIYASHVLEHFDRWKFKAVLEEWRRILSPGGVLRLAVPDFAACVKAYERFGLNDGYTGIVGLVCGGQRNLSEYHHMIFDYPLLERVLKGVGFREVRKWDWRATEHAAIDDYSQAYLPHMDKENGLHMSLNVEAVK